MAFSLVETTGFSCPALPGLASNSCTYLKVFRFISYLEWHISPTNSLGTTNSLLSQLQRLKEYVSGGDYHHHCNVLALGEGEMIVVRNPAGKHPSNPSSFLLCPDCLGFFKGGELWRHNKRCKHKTSELKKWKKVQLEAKRLLPTASISTAEELHSRVISAMKNESISFVARHDKVILQFGNPGEGWEKGREP